MQRWYCHPADQLPSILNISSHISRTRVPVPLNNCHKSETIDYTLDGLWELECMQIPLWFIHIEFFMMKNCEIIQEVRMGPQNTCLID